MTIAGLDASELVDLALLLVAVGALSGFLAGVFGIGGGAVLVMPTSLLTAGLGVRVARAMSKRTLEVAFGGYLLIVGSGLC
jgi:uncharacterized membrane protein YfcA